MTRKSHDFKMYVMSNFHLRFQFHWNSISKRAKNILSDSKTKEKSWFLYETLIYAQFSFIYSLSGRLWNVVRSYNAKKYSKSNNFFQQKKKIQTPNKNEISLSTENNIKSNRNVTSVVELSGKDPFNFE